MTPTENDYDRDFDGMCPACNAPSHYVRSLDLFFHRDGSGNRDCWRHIIGAAPVSGGGDRDLRRIKRLVREVAVALWAGDMDALYARVSDLEYRVAFAIDYAAPGGQS